MVDHAEEVLAGVEHAGDPIGLDLVEAAFEPQEMGVAQNAIERRA